MTVNTRYKKRHINSEHHKLLTKSIITNYMVENPNFFNMKEILKKYIDNYNKKFVLYIINIKWKVHFLDSVIDIKSDRLCNLYIPSKKLRPYLISKIDCLEDEGHRFSHISQMNIKFVSNIRDITYEEYLRMPKPMIEWTLIKKLASNPNLIKSFNVNSHHPLIRRYRRIVDIEEI